MIQKRKEQNEGIKDFIDNNPYPDQSFSARPMKQLYNKDYHDLFHEDEMMKFGKVVDEIQISGANDEGKMKRIMISTNLHVQNLFEYNGDKDTGKHQIVSKKTVSTIQEQHFKWDIQ